MIRLLLGMSLVIAFTFGGGCKRDGVEEKAASASKDSSHDDDAHDEGAGGGHDHHEDDGHNHAAHGENDGHDHAAHGENDGHGHGEEVDLGSVTIGNIKAAVAQGHGTVAAGKESHLVVKLPYSDKGASIVRAWLGTEDRTLSLVGKGEYASSHNEYSVHALAPKPLPADVMWWIEIAKPDGTKAVGSIKPLLD